MILYDNELVKKIREEFDNVKSMICTGKLMLNWEIWK